MAPTTQNRYPATQAQSRVFAESLLSTLRTVPFGALPKTELDLALFAAMVDAGILSISTPVFDLARRLEITPTRVRSLLYRYRLHTQGSEESTLDDIAAALGRSHFELTGSRIVFGIEDPYVRDSFSALLKQQGDFADTSFNPETVSLSLDAFVSFVDARLSDDDRRELLAALQRDTPVELNLFKRVLKGVLSKLGATLMGAAAESAASDLVDVAWQFTTSLAKGDVHAVLAESRRLP
jgi:hypothetical protein